MVAHITCIWVNNFPKLIGTDVIPMYHLNINTSFLTKNTLWIELYFQSTYNIPSQLFKHKKHIPHSLGALSLWVWCLWMLYFTFISVTHKYVYCSMLMRFSKAHKPLPKLLSITSAEELRDRNNNLLLVDYIHTTNITLLTRSIRESTASEPSYECGMFTA